MAKPKTDWVALARADAQPQVPEPIDAIGWLQPAGMLALTATSIHVFSATPARGGTMKVRDFNDAFLAAVTPPV